jgi:hypothetical protein
LISIAFARDKPREKLGVAYAPQARTLRMIASLEQATNFFLEALFEHGVHASVDASVEFWARSVEA